MSGYNQYGELKLPSTRELTVRDALEVKVGLSLHQVLANPLKVDLVLHVRHGDKRRYDTGASCGLQYRGDTTVPHISGSGKNSAGGVGRHGEVDSIVLECCAALHHKVVL